MSPLKVYVVERSQEAHGYSIEAMFATEARAQAYATARRAEFGYAGQPADATPFTVSEWMVAGDEEPPRDRASLDGGEVVVSKAGFRVVFV